MTNKLTEYSTTDLQEIAYTYDDVGNITAITDTSDTDASKTAAYVYDDLYRLTSATITNTGNSSNYTRTYTYSVTGNINSKSDVGSYTYGDIHPHAVTSANSITYTYDDNGSLTGDGTWTHTWNNRNQVSSSDDGTDSIDFEYDEGGRRITKDDGTTATLYINKYYDKKGADDVLYIYGGNLKLATINDSATAFNHLDHLSGSNISTDTNGDELELNDYYPYGQSRIDDRTGGYTNNYLYTGKELDRETDLYYYGARYYDPLLGRFVSVDPLVLDIATKTNKEFADIIDNPQTLNAYSYVLNNPLRYVDPTGEANLDQAGKGLIKMGVGFELSLASVIVGLESPASAVLAFTSGVGLFTSGLSDLIEGILTEDQPLDTRGVSERLSEVYDEIGSEVSTSAEIEFYKGVYDRSKEAGKENSPSFDTDIFTDKIDNSKTEEKETEEEANNTD